MIQDIIRHMIISQTIKESLPKTKAKESQSDLKQVNEFLHYTVQVVETGAQSILKLSAGLVRTAIDIVTFQVTPDNRTDTNPNKDQTNG